MTIPLRGGARQPRRAPSGPAQTFVYIGADRDLDLAGPDVAPAADGQARLRRPPRPPRAASVAGEVVGSSTGEPNQAFPLASSPVIIETLAVEVDEGAGLVEWTAAPEPALPRQPGRPASSSRRERARLLRASSTRRAATCVVFGDGEYGRRPPSGATTSRASYVVGGGAAGNVAAGADRRGEDAGSAGPGHGHEPRRRQRAGRTRSRSSGRCGSARSPSAPGSAPSRSRDFVSLALHAGGVGKVRARTTGWNRVDLYVAPEGETCTRGARRPQAPARLVLRGAAGWSGRRSRIEDPVCVPDRRLRRARDRAQLSRRRRFASSAELAVADLLAFAERRLRRGRCTCRRSTRRSRRSTGCYAATVTRFRRQDQASAADAAPQGAPRRGPRRRQRPGRARVPAARSRSRDGSTSARSSCRRRERSP